MSKIRGRADIFNLRIPGGSGLPCIWMVWVCVLFAAMGCRPGPEGRRADLVIANSVEPESLDPVFITGQADARVVESLFEGLLRIDPESAAPVPGLAASWTVSEDSRVYTFSLRPGIRWSDGRPITAMDFEKSWKRALDPANAARYAGLMFAIEGAEAFHTRRDEKAESGPGFRALDDQTFEVRLVEPRSYFLHLLTMPIFAATPAHAILESPIRWILEEDVPVSGAYCLEWWRLNDSIRVRRNPLYWDNENTRSEVVDFLPISNPSTALNLYLMGDVDVIWDKDLVPTHVVDELMGRDDFHQFDYLGTYFLRFNTTLKPFDDPRVRRALSLAIDRERITLRITRAGEKPAATFVPSGTHGYDFGRTPVIHNPSRARQLLAEAGYPDGKGFPPVEYYFNGASSGPASNHQKIAVELQAMWKEHLNIQVKLKKNEWKVFLVDQESLNYQVSRSSWIGDYNDANTFLEIFTSSESNNRTGWKNSQFDALIDQANRTLDGDARESLLRQAEFILLEEAPIAPVYFYKGTHMFDANRVHGIHFNILDRHPVRAVSVSPGH